MRMLSRKRSAAREVVEQLIVGADPARDVVDPGAVGELAAAEIAVPSASATSRRCAVTTRTRSGHTTGAASRDPT